MGHPQHKDRPQKAGLAVMLLTAVTAKGVANSCMGCIYLKIASAVLEEVLECAWEEPLAWGLMQQGCLLRKLAGKRRSCGER